MALTLKYDFATDKSLVADTGPTLSITRTTSATYFDVSGVLQTATTGVARFDHDPVTNESLGLLIEEARTNLINYSNDWTNWFAGSGGTTTTAAAATSPDGTTNATELAIIDSGQDREICNNITTSTATDYTCSCFIKNVDSARTQFRVWSLTDSNNTSTLNVAWTGAVPSTFNATNAANVTYQDVGNDWYRVSYTWTTSGTSVSENLNLHPAVTGTGTESIYVYGAQIEEASFPSSYIATSGATATRNADVVSTTDVTWFDALGGTFYAAGRQDTHISGSNAVSKFVWSLSDGTANESFRNILPAGGSTIGSVVRDGGAAQFNDATGNTWIEGQKNRIAFAALANDFASSYNGDTVVTDTSGTIPTVTTLRVGSNDAGTSEFFNGHIADLCYYDERLADAVVQSLSAGPAPFMLVGSLALAGVTPTILVSLSVDPTIESLALASAAPTASVSDHQTADPTVETLALTGAAPTISIVDLNLAVSPSVGALALTGAAPAISIDSTTAITKEPAVVALALTGAAPTIGSGIEIVTDPIWDGTQWALSQVADTVTAAEAPTNSDAGPVPDNILICDRTGFKVSVKEGLREEWNGRLVRKKSWEPRNAQDFVRGRPEQLSGSDRPEQSDTFLSTNEVSASDL